MSTYLFTYKITGKNKLIIIGVFLILTSVFVLFKRETGVTNQANINIKPDSINKEFTGSLDIFSDYQVGQDINEKFNVFILNENPTVHSILISKKKEVILPSLLSDYDFISIHSNHQSYQSYSFTDIPLATSKFTLEKIEETPNYKYTQYLAEDGHWGHFYIPRNSELRKTVKFHNPKKIRPEDLNTVGGIFVHAKEKETFGSFLQIVIKNLVISDRVNTSTNVSLIPNRIVRTTNYIDPENKYSLYIPPRYLNSKNFQFSSFLYNTKDTEICIPIKEYPLEACGFSTSGCTCCNTGCGLIDIAFYLNPIGQYKVEAVLDKGINSGEAKFVYDPENPWVWYAGSIKTPIDGYKTKVIDLILMADSIKRLY